MRPRVRGQPPERDRGVRTVQVFWPYSWFNVYFLVRVPFLNQANGVRFFWHCESTGTTDASSSIAQSKMPARLRYSSLRQPIPALPFTEARLRCAAPCQSRARATWRPLRYRCLSQAAFAPSVRWRCLSSVGRASRPWRRRAEDRHSPLAMG